MLVPMLDLTLELAATAGAREVVIGMAHRGRLNVLAHTIGRPYDTIFAEFEGGRFVEGNQLTPEGGTGDVKYHHGAEGAFRRAQREVHRRHALAQPEPPRVRLARWSTAAPARSRRCAADGAPITTPVVAMPVLIHGDAAFAGQGVVAETFNLSALKGYEVGGTLHIITNNQVGFTTDAEDARSTRYASDLAKGFDVPIIHVNSDDAEACLAAVRLAMAYRDTFRRDAVIDLVGYRRHGHNEGDEPTYTQPLMYERIKELPPVRDALRGAARGGGHRRPRRCGPGVRAGVPGPGRRAAALQGEPGQEHGAGERQSRSDPGQEPVTAVAAETLTGLNDQLLTVPEGFTVNPKLKRQLDRRRAAVGAEGGIDWAHAEALSLASLLVEGVPVRLTGQDTERGTFSQRHLVLHDVKTGDSWTPMQRLPGATAPLELHNSPLSELATIGFEYGYSAEALGGAGALGGAVRRLHQRRAGHRRPVPRGGPLQVGPHDAAHAAAAARLRRPGTGALERPARAVPPARR